MADILYAPNIHSGGGLTLLKELVFSWSGENKLIAILDARCKHEFNDLNFAKVNPIFWVKSNFISRVKSELVLRKIVKKNDSILCLHNLPPILCRHKNVNIFMQNRLLIKSNLFTKIPLGPFIFLIIQRLIIRIFYSPDYKYIVQTESMKNELSEWFRNRITLDKNLIVNISVFPFSSSFELIQERENTPLRWDFIYPADGYPYKNHLKLIEAWNLLAKDGIYPSLAFTIGAEHQNLIKKIQNEIKKMQLKIVNLGQLSHDKLIKELCLSGALIFPSKVESFGLPLVEAEKLGLPILASELDFVRDVIEPIETFNPDSAISICRAVKRFLGVSKKPLKCLTGNEFWACLKN
jgi:glycosyltransferase involved in cell wall biosynthesis